MIIITFHSVSTMPEQSRYVLNVDWLHAWINELIHTGFIASIVNM